MPQRRSIYEYDNYRNFLKEEMVRLRSEDSKFSHRSFAKKAGMRSPSFFLDVIKGKNNLSIETIEKVAGALDLNKDETYHFRNLTLLNQSTTADERMLYAQQILKSKYYRMTFPLTESTCRYFTHWYYVAIKELAAFPDFEDDPQWIYKRLNGVVPIVEIRRALVELEKLSILTRDPSGKLREDKDVIITPDEVSSSFITSYHEQLIRLGADSIRKYPRDMRDISATTFKISRKNLKSIKEILQRFRKEIVAILAEEKNPEGLFQINMQLFPISPFQSEEERDEIE